MSTNVRSTRLSALLVLFRAVITKQITLMIRYPINLLSSILVIYGFFALIFFGGQAFVGAQITDQLNGLVVGFFLWSMAQTAFIGLTWNITREAQWGTLEQLYLTTHGFELLMLVKSAANVVVSFLTGVFVLLLMMVTTQSTVHVDLFTIVPIIALGLWSIIGVGFVFGGLAIIYKRIENAFQILSFGLVGLISAPAASIPAFKALPLTQASSMLFQAMAGGVRLWEFAPAELAILIGVAFCYSAIGVVFFRFAQRRARSLGVLGHY